MVFIINNSEKFPDTRVWSEPCEQGQHGGHGPCAPQQDRRGVGVGKGTDSMGKRGGQ